MKKILLILCAVVLAALAFGGKPLYQHAMALRLQRAAEQAVQKEKFPDAARLYGLALARRPFDLGILHSCADFLKRIHSPEELMMRKRIWDLEPKSGEAFLDYVESAMFFQKPRLARQLLLHATAPELIQSGRYAQLLSVSYYLSQELPQAEANAAEAVRREPANATFQINLATVRLADAATQEAAVAALEKWSTDPAQGAVALQALLNFAASARQEPPRLSEWLATAEKVITSESLFFPARLKVERRWRPADFNRDLPLYLEAEKRFPETALIAEAWLQQQGLNQQLLDYRSSLPEAWQTNSKSLTLAAEAIFQLQAYDRIPAFFEEPAWKRLHESAQLIWKERLRRSTTVGDSPDEARVRWTRILASAHFELPALLDLTLWTAQWSWLPENEEALWSVADTHAADSSTDALIDLGRIAFRRGDGPMLLRVFNGQLKETPDDPALQNNIAFLSFLYNSETSRATRICDELRAQHPEAPEYVATSAFGRLVKGDVAGGLRLFDGAATKPAPGTAAGVTYGLLLAAKGDPSAAKFLENAERWIHLPEERQWIDKARKQIAR